MSINGVFRTSVSGMNAQANRLSAVSDNIANSDTPGYKRNSAEFSTIVLAQGGGGGGDYNSGSVRTQVRQSITQSGSIAGTSSSTDLAIQGNGFFVVQDAAGREFYTRAGAFVQKTETVGGVETTYLVNSAGYRLTGTAADGKIGPITLPVGEIQAPEASTTANLDFQLPTTAAVGDTKTSSLIVYDDVGTPTSLTFTLTKTTGGWDVSATDGTTTTTSSLTFTGGVGTATPATMNFPLGGGAVDLNFGTLTEYNTAYSARLTADGNPAGSFTDFSVDENGVVSGVMDNGATKELYTVNLANFSSPDQLTANTGNVYSANQRSGTVTYGAAGSNGFGTMASRALEQSNVDLAGELTDMISAQRSYSANSKVFQTGSEILDVLVNLKR
ncbi:flagellar hook protein FlgE [Aurantimonas sp. VKM B-3413]|uniref:flagellar hook protein FlgE n=1 Tax=Aurantimonas sp. VKM B-3413 TaxID=2779401 RepID=UPI001E3F2889|nr:flagellar hook protein FlgE [Aurantimonas sp. VKM B-3413]MCB8838134.1 flagellar hook protein FlgE [Aurantimonas sp. VKM B-3413]